MTTDNGENWIPKNNGLIDLHIESLIINGNNLYTGTHSGIFLSTDNGNNWRNIAFDDIIIFALYIKDNYIFESGSGINLYIDNGNTWTEHSSGITNFDISGFIINGDYIFAASTFHGLYKAKLSDLITDVKENEQNKETIIYPNPALLPSVKLKYESTNNSKLQILIFDLLGNEVFSSSEDCNIGMNEKDY